MAERSPTPYSTNGQVTSCNTAELNQSPLGDRFSDLQSVGYTVQAIKCSLPGSSRELELREYALLGRRQLPQLDHPVFNL